MCRKVEGYTIRCLLEGLPLIVSPSRGLIGSAGLLEMLTNERGNRWRARHTAKSTLLAMRSEGRLLAGRERIVRLEAVAKRRHHRSRLVQLQNGLRLSQPKPAFVAKTSGSSGRRRHDHWRGLRLIAAFRKLEERRTRISTAIADEGLEQAEDA